MNNRYQHFIQEVDERLVARFNTAKLPEKFFTPPCSTLLKLSKVPYKLTNFHHQARLDFRPDQLVRSGLPPTIRNPGSPYIAAYEFTISVGLQASYHDERKYSQRNFSINHNCGKCETTCKLPKRKETPTTAINMQEPSTNSDSSLVQSPLPFATNR